MSTLICGHDNGRRSGQTGASAPTEWGTLAIRTRTIAANGAAELVVKKSRFIGSLGRVSSEADAQDFIAVCKKQYWDANHNCSAWVIGERAELQRSNDDGEPSGTAGAPMLNVLNQRELTDVVAVVTRYFGGTLLGAGGLIRAYGQVVSDSVDTVGMVERVPLHVVRVRANHEDAGRLDNAMRSTQYHLDDVIYAENVIFTLHLKGTELPVFENWLSEFTAGQCSVETIGVKIIDTPATKDKIMPS